MGANIENDKKRLKILIEKIAEENDYKNANIVIDAISTGGANYSSGLYISTISAKNKEDIELFAKIGSASEEMRNSNVKFELTYITERIFYSKLANIFQNLYNKYNVRDRLYIPKYYGHDSTDRKETLVLENLVTKGFGSFDRLKSIDWNYASAAITELAKFHALGVACVKDKLEDLSKIESADIFANQEFVNAFEERAIKMGTQAVKVKYRSKMLKHFEINSFRKVMNMLWKKKNDGFFVHGDYRPSNLMHRNLNGIVEVVPIDYQTCHLGYFTVDLMYFIWLGSDSEFRKKHYREAIEHYYSKLTTALKSLHVDIDNVYPRKVYEQELEETKYLGLFLGLTMSAIHTIDAEDAPKLGKPEDLLPSPNQLGLDMMNGVVGDYIKWGFI